VSAQLQDIAKALRTARCSRGPMIDGAPCDDVRAELIHISLADMPEGPEKAQLLAIPTGLTLEPHDVDLLVAAGQTAITTSEPLRSFLDNYPLQPPGATPRKARTHASR
jgi:hypothetical protein